MEPAISISQRYKRSYKHHVIIQFNFGFLSSCFTALVSFSGPGLRAVLPLVSNTAPIYHQTK